MQRFFATSVEAAVEELITYLEDTSSAAQKSIYFDGWYGLGASAVLRAIAENPAPSLRKKFDRKNPRQLQRAIADQLKLPQHVMDLFDRQDEEDDFSGVEESSRAEIADIRREIYRTFMDLTYLLILNNGSDHTLDIASFGFPLNDIASFGFPLNDIASFGHDPSLFEPRHSMYYKKALPRCSLLR
uniref:Uncharacterized protein n=1 Tax=Oryza nivara TaxID=4536 RepID=A0A0E0ICU4_ORYNI